MLNLIPLACTLGAVFGANTVFVSPFPKVDQLGYRPGVRKIFRINQTSAAPGDSFQVVDAAGRVGFRGVLSNAALDTASAENVMTGDFSDLRDTGSWIVKVGGLRSAGFRISETVWAPLFSDALKAFQTIRCGTGVSDERISYSHPICHAADIQIRGSDRTGDFLGGWHNAGDFGKWTHMAAISIANFLWLVELDLSRGAAPPDAGDALIQEARWGLDWLFKMQLSDGSVYHKVDSEGAFAFGSEPQDDDLERFASLQAADSTQIPSSFDAAVFTGVMAQSARVLADVDADYATRCRNAAMLSWSWLASHPGVPQSDPYYAVRASAGAELWARSEIARLTGSDSLRTAAANLIRQGTQEVSWLDPRLFGVQALATDPSASLAVRQTARRAIASLATSLKAKSAASGHGVALYSSEYVWESNEIVLHRGVALVFAAWDGSDPEALDAAQSQLDYILGVNALDTSFVSGQGQKAIRKPYHWLLAATRNRMFPGWVTGGPNQFPDGADDPLLALQATGAPPAKCFVDQCFPNGSWASNEGETSEESALLFLAGALSPAGTWNGSSTAVHHRTSTAAGRLHRLGNRRVSISAREGEDWLAQLFSPDGKVLFELAGSGPREFDLPRNRQVTIALLRCLGRTDRAIWAPAPLDL